VPINHLLEELELVVPFDCRWEVRDRSIPTVEMLMLGDGEVI
jgi:hypothetical protein